MCRKWNLKTIKKTIRVKITKFKILIGIFFIVISSLFLLLKYYNKPHKDIRNLKADYVLNAQYLLNEFQQDEDSATKKYTNNIVQVKGQIFEISTLNGNSVITLKKQDSESSIICHLLPEDNINVLKLKKGQNVAIKGICTGFLLDVIMVRCVIDK